MDWSVEYSVNSLSNINCPVSIPFPMSSNLKWRKSFNKFLFVSEAVPQISLLVSSGAYPKNQDLFEPVPPGYGKHVPLHGNHSRNIIRALIPLFIVYTSLYFLPKPFHTIHVDVFFIVIFASVYQLSGGNELIITIRNNQ